MVSPEARAEIAKMFAKKREEAKRFPGGRPLDVARREWEAEARLYVLPKGARFSGADAGGVKSEWMEMPHVGKNRAFLLLHGGGYDAGSPRTHRKLAALLSRAAYAPVLTPDYRLAPEHPFPAAVKDALKAYGYLLSEGFTEDNIIVGGDSAGGGLALSMLLALREAGAKMPKAAVLLSPWTDLTASSGSYEKLRKRDPIITREGLREAGLWYAGKRDPADPMASPLFADPSGLPPLLIHAGADETMLDDSRIFAERARAAGVAVTFKIYDGMWHVHHHAAPEVPEAVVALNDVAAFIRSQFGD
ncbi:MAG: alpha/beta hydrolase [Devosia nanyangense]|uniref:Alpha/beta hydrolase n=1 Tax=Devosia nanyangense TaxID=1228055 RepID=A0A933KYR3_9HYPH|nr:alpha/beta hydrolase [Devosia nanyangense]